MKTANFQAGGPPISVTIRCGFADTGSYEVFLWEADRNSRRSIGIGNFINADDDTFTLPSDSGQNGKILQCIATVDPLDDDGKFGVSMIVEQGSSELAVEEVTGKSGLPTVTVQLFIQLAG
jgi:hypothetical protein